MNSVIICARVTAWMLNISHQQAVLAFTKKVYKETNNIYQTVENHLSILNSAGDPEDKANAFGRALYANYPEFIPFGLTEEEKDQWMYRLGEAATCVKFLEKAFGAHLNCTKTVLKFILHRDVASLVLESAERVAGLYDPPPSNRIMAKIRSQLNRWKYDEVIIDDDVENSTVINRALQLREEMASLVRTRRFYDRENYPRFCREAYASLREAVRSFLYGQRSHLAAQENLMRQSRLNVASFILTQMGDYNDDTLEVISSVLKRSTFHSYTDKMISLESLNRAAKAIRDGDVDREGTEEDDGRDESEIVDFTAPSTSHGIVTEEVITLTAPNFEVFDPTGTFIRPRAFTRPPPKPGHKRKYVSIPRAVARERCEEEIRELEQQEQENREAIESPEEPKKKRAKVGKKRCRKGNKMQKK